MIIAHESKKYNEFKNLLNNTTQYMKSDSAKRVDYYLKRGGTALEKDVFRTMCSKATGTIFEGKIELVSGKKFPDIVTYVNQNHAFGLEVKTTVHDKWKSVGSSIFEGTRVPDVSKIHLLFGKLSSPIDFICRKYEDCLYDVAITHSPRYLIDMKTKDDKSIFSKIGVPYDEIRQMTNPFAPIKKYLRKNIKHGDNIWWVDSNEEANRDFKIRLWHNLSHAKKEELRIEAFAHFPSLLSNCPAKYYSLATWLVAQFGVVNHALRDTFTAGGTVSIDGTDFPKIFLHLTENLPKIYAAIDRMELDDIEFYWKVSTLTKSKKEVWKELSLKNSAYLEKKQLDKLGIFLLGKNI